MAVVPSRAAAELSTWRATVGDLPHHMIHPAISAAVRLRTISGPYTSSCNFRDKAPVSVPDNRVQLGAQGATSGNCNPSGSRYPAESPPSHRGRAVNLHDAPAAAIMAAGTSECASGSTSCAQLHRPGVMCPKATCEDGAACTHFITRTAASAPARRITLGSHFQYWRWRSRGRRSNSTISRYTGKNGLGAPTASAAFPST